MGPESPGFKGGDEWLLRLTTGCSRDHTPSGRLRQSHCPQSCHHRCARARRGRMLLYEYKLRLSPAQASGDRRGDPHDAVHPQQSPAPVDGWAGRERQRPAAALRPPGARVRLCRSPQLASPPGRRLPRLGGHRALLHQLPGEATGEEGLSPLPTRLPLGGVQADGMAARR